MDAWSTLWMRTGERSKSISIDNRGVIGVRKSLFLVVRVKTPKMKRGLFIPMPLFVIDEVVGGLADLAELWVRLTPGPKRRDAAHLGPHPIEWIRTVAGIIPELRAYGRWTLVEVESKDTRIYVSMY